MRRTTSGWSSRAAVAVEAQDPVAQDPVHEKVDRPSELEVAPTVMAEAAEAVHHLAVHVFQPKR